MHDALSTFIQTTQQALRDHPGPEGRQVVCRALEALLRNESFVESAVEANTLERNKVYEDPDLGFCVLIHTYAGPKSSGPHDHGPSWAIYGQAQGETFMTDYALVSPATDSVAGRVRALRRYSLQPGDAHLYNEGDLHAPERKAATRLIRIEGVDMLTVKRMRYEEI